MDKKYKAVPTLKGLDLSRGTRSSLSSSSGKSTFSTQSKEDRYNEAFKNDFKSSPKKEAGMDIKPKKLPPLKPQKLPPLKDKITNPLTGKEVSIAYYKTLVKSGKISDTSSQAKTGKIDFFSPPPETLPQPPSISLPKPESPESPLYPSSDLMYGLHEYLEDLKEKNKYDQRTFWDIQEEIVDLYYNNPHKIVNFKEQLNTLLAKLPSNISPKVIKSMERNITNMYDIARKRKKEYYSYLTTIKKVNIN